jgi:hypothetical protein
VKDWLKVFKVEPGGAVFVITNESAQPGGQLRVTIQARFAGTTVMKERSFESSEAASVFFDAVDRGFVVDCWRSLNNKLLEQLEHHFLYGQGKALPAGVCHA